MKCPTCGHTAKISKPRTSLKTHKYAQCFKNHDEHCYCVDCAPTRLNGLRSQWRWIQDGGAKLADLRAVVDATPITDAPDHSAEIDTYSSCVCGHSAENHAADELENLLQCEACECDHFHYAIDESEAA